MPDPLAKTRGKGEMTLTDRSDERTDWTEIHHEVKRFRHQPVSTEQYAQMLSRMNEALAAETHEMADKMETLNRLARQMEEKSRAAQPAR